MASAVEEGAHGREGHVPFMAVSSHGHAAYAILGEERVEGLGGVDGWDVNVTAGSCGVLLDGGEDNIEVLEDGDADG